MICGVECCDCDVDFVVFVEVLFVGVGGLEECYVVGIGFCDIVIGCFWVE